MNERAGRFPGLRPLAGLLAAALPIIASVAADAAPQAATADVVISGGRVIDPETGLDAVRNIAVRGGEIVSVSAEALVGDVVIDATGLVVAPGFIDLHAHGQTNRANEYQAHDGVTTALELEGGVPDVRAFIEQREGDALINFGASLSHGGIRMFAMPAYAEALAEAEATVSRDGELPPELLRLFSRASYEAVPPERFEELSALLERGMRAGALGIGMPHQYYPGATRAEIFRVFQVAAALRVPIFTHVRDMGVDAIQEVLADAAITGAPLHIVHVNSSSLWDIGTILEMIAAARERGIDVTTEAYPYTAASTGLQSAIFDAGWDERLRISYGDLQWQDTGERLTEETFARYRAEGGTVIIHMMKPEWIERAMSTPFVMIASDGMPYAPGAHPRSAGTFSRVLGRYVREQGVMSLPDAIRRMTLMPARRLEGITPQMLRKGRLQVGADADITVFDPNTIIDTATFEDDLSFSRGVRHVLVNGTFVVRDGESVAGVRPGRPIVGRYAGH